MEIQLQQHKKKEFEAEGEENRLLQSEECETIPLSSPQSSISISLDLDGVDREDCVYAAKDKIHIFDLESNGNNVGSTVVPPFSWKKLWLFTGPGLLMSVAFLDPGNLEGDLQAGAIAGYSLLWLLMWSTIMGLLIQLLSARLGVATGRHLAELCREEYSNWARLVLWFLAELALIAADIQEVIGSAIALKILSHGILPIWAGVVITAFDCFFFLFLENYGVRKLEGVFAVFIGTMGFAFAWMFFDTKPNEEELLMGLLIPRVGSKTLRQAVEIVGCVITPHNVFLHSALVQSRDIDIRNKGQVQEALNYYSIESSIALLITLIINLFVIAVFARVFYGTEQAKDIGLVNAGQYLEEKYGGGFFPILYIWGIGLLAAGQSSTITGTYAGQFITEGFLKLNIKKWLRALITRSCAIVPTMIVAIVFNTSEGSLDTLNEWLNVLQAIQIPFALIPLLTLVSKEEVMGTFRIGPLLERVAWTVVVLVIMLYGYMLLDFFLSEVKGLLFGFLVFLGAAAWISFIAFLLRHSGAISSIFLKSPNSEGFSLAN
ncbi:metal transporter Nramp2 [Lathyrus oleraceus]|uniref:Natural resistance-associated macrophage protein 2 n=1 Tax=Pisum sativum TaxID=3888 RepID=A0A9D4XKB6_PEA|nr:metal transporter Nramp2-like [Pisum sativum]KAI5421938.1 Natural resistance-associated macrophage protein 2 [Pisum sativum]